MANEKASFSADEVIDLRDLMAAIWWSKWIIIVLAALGAIYGLYKLQQHQPSYTAELMIAHKVTSGVSNSSGGLGRLANVIGIGTGGVGDPMFDRLRLMLDSVELARRLEEKHKFINLVYKDSWNPETKTWIRPTGMKFEFQQAINAFLKRPLWSEPSLGTLAESISGAIEFEPVDGTNFWSMRYSHTDPEYAKNFLTTVHQEVDNLLRAQDRAQAIQRKQYLEGALQRVNLEESRDIMASLLMREENGLMLLSTSLNYAGRLIAEPAVSSRPDVPDLTKLVVVPSMGLGILGMVGALFLRLYKKGA